MAATYRDAWALVTGETCPWAAGRTTVTPTASYGRAGQMRESRQGAHRGVLAAAAVVIVSVLALHFGATFLYVAPSNVVWERHGATIRDHLHPEFRQAWNLFAPDVPQVSLTLHARAEVRGADGDTGVTDWVDLSATDLAALHGNPLPSRGREQLRKAWSEVRANWDENEDPVGQWGEDVRLTVVRVALERLDLPAGSTPEWIQFRTVFTDTPPPRWTGEVVAEEPTVVEHSWWLVDVQAVAGVRP